MTTPGRSGYFLVRILSLGRHPDHLPFEGMVVGHTEPDEVPGAANWEGFSIFSEVHPCTPEEDEQQHTEVCLVDFITCDHPDCGGYEESTIEIGFWYKFDYFPGGWLAWYSCDPAHHPDHPDNPLAPYK